jgi:hypothetical protein
MQSSVMAVCEELGCSNVCAQWMPQMLTDAYKEARTEIATNLLYSVAGKGGDGMKSRCTILNQNPSSN